MSCVTAVMFFVQKPIVLKVLTDVHIAADRLQGLSQ